MVVDPAADAKEAQRLYGITFGSMEDVKDMDAVIIAVAHNEFDKLDSSAIDAFFASGNKVKVLMDLKGILKRSEYENRKDYLYWRL